MKKKEENCSKKYSRIYKVEDSLFFYHVLIKKCIDYSLHNWKACALFFVL